MVTWEMDLDELEFLGSWTPTFNARIPFELQSDTNLGRIQIEEGVVLHVFLTDMELIFGSFEMFFQFSTKHKMKIRVPRLNTYLKWVTDLQENLTKLEDYYR